jgi:hypothetical protein
MNRINKMNKYSISIALVILMILASLFFTQHVVNTVSKNLTEDRDELIRESNNRVGWQKQHTNLNDKIPRGVIISTKEQNGIKAIRIEYTKNKPISFNIGGTQPKQLDNGSKDFIEDYRFDGIEENTEIKFDGPGMVIIKNIKTVKIFKLYIASFLVNHGYSWIPGTLLGIFGGIFGVAAGILVPRGKGKKIIIIMGAIGILYSLVLLIIGFIYMAYGEGWFLWYPYF